MHTITTQGFEFQISNYPWSSNGYTPKVVVNISYNEHALTCCLHRLKPKSSLLEQSIIQMYAVIAV